uniref:Receptor activity modifying protein 2 n=1 Tax=Aotus nancymaae TaxID=37293 RepID=A0A2K5F990_AOTNA
MASLRAERAGDPRLATTRAGRPAALRLLLLLGAVLKPQETLAQPLPTTSTPGSEGLIAPCETAWSTLRRSLTWASPILWQRGSSLRLTRSTLPIAPWCNPLSQTPRRMYSWP